MRGRKKKQNAKRNVIRITDKLFFELYRTKKELSLPYYFRESEIMQYVLTKYRDSLDLDSQNLISVTVTEIK